MYSCKSVFLLSFLFTSTLFSFAVATACSCVPSPSPLNALKNAKVVFSGKVINTRKESRSLPSKSKKTLLTGHWFWHTIKVYRVWKGEVKKTIQLRTADDSCQFYLSNGDEVLIYSQFINPITVGQCSRSTQLKYAQSDLKKLGPGKTPSR